MKRLACRLLGCRAAVGWPWCVRCGAPACHPSFIGTGWLEWPRVSALWLREALRPPRCLQCGRRLRRGAPDCFCSAECMDEYLPF